MKKTIFAAMVMVSVLGSGSAFAACDVIEDSCLCYLYSESGAVLGSDVVACGERGADSFNDLSCASYSNGKNLRGCHSMYIVPMTERRR